MVLVCQAFSVFSAETYITEGARTKSTAKLIPENSVIIAMYGNGDTAGRVAINKIPVATNQACLLPTILKSSQSLPTPSSLLQPNLISLLHSGGIGFPKLIYVQKRFREAL